MPVIDVVHPLAIQTSLKDTFNIIEERDRHIINRIAIMKRFSHVYAELERMKNIVKR